MSYILDALKKADSERQHGKVPNIHAQPISHNALSAEDSSSKNPLMWVFLIVLVIMIGVFLMFYNWKNTPTATVVSRAEPISVAPSVPTASNISVAPIAAPVPSTPVAPIVTAAINAAPTPPMPAMNNSAPVEALPAEPVKVKPSSQNPPHVKKAKRSPAASTTDASSKKSGLKQVAEPPPSEKIEMTLRDLPQTIQNEIPPLTVGGYIYSDNKADSQLLINKLLLHEGEQISPGLILEKMMPHSAILSYKGYRYRISY